MGSRHSGRQAGWAEEACFEDFLRVEGQAVKRNPSVTPSVWTPGQIIAARPTLQPVLDAVTGTLQRYGLVGQNDQTGKVLAR